MTWSQSSAEIISQITQRLHIKKNMSSKYTKHALVPASPAVYIN